MKKFHIPQNPVRLALAAMVFFVLSFSGASGSDQLLYLPDNIKLGNQLVSSSGWQYAVDVATTDDMGRVYTLGFIQNVDYRDDRKFLSMSRNHADGKLDTTFGTGGFTFLNLTGTISISGTGLAIQPDGKIVALSDFYRDIGESALSYDVLTRFNSNGSIDQGFSSGGSLLISQIAGRGESLKIQDDGKIVFRRGIDRGFDYTFLGGEIVRLTPAGAMDSSFGSAGQVASVAIQGKTLRFGNLPIQFDVKPGGGFVCTVGNVTDQYDAPTYDVFHLTPSGVLDAAFPNLKRSGTVGSVDDSLVHVNVDGTYVIEEGDGMYRQYNANGSRSDFPTFRMGNIGSLMLHRGNYVGLQTFASSEALIFMRAQFTGKPTPGFQGPTNEPGSLSLTPAYPDPDVDSNFSSAGISNDRFVILESRWTKGYPVQGYLRYVDITPKLKLPKSQEILGFGALPNRLVGDSPFEVKGVTATSGLPVRFVSSNPEIVFVKGHTLKIRAAGKVTITATQSGNEDYAAAPAIAREMKVEKRKEAIKFATKPTRKYFKNRVFMLQATSLSGRKAVFISSNPKVIQIKGRRAVIRGVGKVTIRAKLMGNDEYRSAKSKRRTVRVEKV